MSPKSCLALKATSVTAGASSVISALPLRLYISPYFSGKGCSRLYKAWKGNLQRVLTVQLLTLFVCKNIFLYRYFSKKDTSASSFFKFHFIVHYPWPLKPNLYLCVCYCKIFYLLKLAKTFQCGACFSPTVSLLLSLQWCTLKALWVKLPCPHVTLLVVPSVRFMQSKLKVHLRWLFRSNF